MFITLDGTLSLTGGDALLGQVVALGGQRGTPLDCLRVKLEQHGVDGEEPSYEEWFSTPTVAINDPFLWESQGGAGTGLNRVLREPLAGPDIEVWAEASGLSGGYIRLVARWDENYLRFQLGTQPELPPIPPRPRPRAETTQWALAKAGAIAPGTPAGEPLGTLASGNVPLVDHDRAALRIESGVIRCDIESFGVVWEGTDPDIPNGAGKVGIQTDGVSLLAFGTSTT